MSRFLLDRKSVRRHLESHFLLRADTDRRRVALTFDDGPSPANTPALLELLERRGMKASFLMVGKRARAFPEIAREVAAAGHEIGQHSDLHLPLPLLPGPLLRRQMRRARESIEDAIGRPPTLFRPPYGWYHRRMLELARAAGQIPVLGDVYPEDTKTRSSETIVRRVLDRLQTGSIVILHDGGPRPSSRRDATLAAVDELGLRLHDQGWEFTTVSALGCASEIVLGGLPAMTCSHGTQRNEQLLGPSPLPQPRL